jgi:hypothetical protein
VFQDQSFWWKRVERVSSELPWFERSLTAVWDLVARAFGALGRLIGRLFQMLFGLATGDWSSGTPLVWVAMALVLAWAAWRFFPLVRRRLHARTAAAGGPDLAPSERLPEALVLFDQAARAVAESRWAEAIRLGLLALIARLQQQGLLRYDPARTNREYQADLRPAQGLAAVFGQVARPYERVWYGGAAATRADAEQVLAWCRPVVTGEGAARG